MNAIASAQRARDDNDSVVRMNLDRLGTSIQKALRRPHLDFGVVLDTLRECSDVRGDGLWEDLEPPEFHTHGEDDLPGYANYARTVQQVLAAYASCKCTQDREDTHWARLRLKPIYETVMEDLVPFDLLFSVEPNPVRTGNFEWQDVQILMPTRKPQVSFQVDWDRPASLHTQGNSSDDSFEFEDEPSLCSFIATKCGAMLCFKVVRQRLKLLRDAPVHSLRNSRITAGLGLHLGQVIDKFKMAYGMRPVLAYALAKAVWYHYDSDWVGMGIANDRIYFLGEGNDEELVYFCKPYLPIELNSGQEQATEYKSEVGMQHRYPKVLALGIMIMALATGKHIEIEGHPENWTPRVSNDQLVRLQDLLDNASENFQEDCRLPNYKRVIQKCLDPRIFDDAQYNSSNKKENLERRRNILYEEVVDPLRQLVKGAGWDKEIQELERIPLVPKYEKRFSRRVVATTLPGDDIASSIDHLAQRADPWLQKVAELNRMLKEEKRKAGGNSNPIRIAVLDTGYDENAPTFDVPGRQSRVKGWRDFVLDSHDPVDVDGHGTHLLTLLLQIECPALFYVARVAEESHKIDTAVDSIAEAIRVAAVEWNVDFVSMSFGFPGYVQKIKNAMAYARYERNDAIVFWAAANNEGLNEGEMFPAILGESAGVISVHGTDRNGAFVRRFNPEALSTPVFGTLGCDVYSDWPGEELQRPMSGCSVATPIAVSIAVMVIDYATSQPAEFSAGDLRLMRTRQGVFELFRGM